MESCPNPSARCFHGTCDRHCFSSNEPFDEDKNERFAMLNKAVDSIRDKYGEDSIKRARFLDNGCTHMSGGLNREKRSHKRTLNFWRFSRYT